MRRHGGSLSREFFVTIIAHRTETAVCIEGDYVGMSQGRIEGFDQVPGSYWLQGFDKTQDM